MKAEQRLCRTADGRLVPETDPDAAFLAYAVGKEISAADEALLSQPAPPAEEVPAEHPEVETKPATPQATKPRKPPAKK